MPTDNGEDITGPPSDTTEGSSLQYDISGDRLKKCITMIRSCLSHGFEVSEAVIDEYNAQIKGN